MIIREVFKQKNRIIKVREVLIRTGLCRATIYIKMADGTFPKNIKLGERSMGWLESDIDNWIDQLIANRDKAA
jgi:prophage regulatory protein